jgi:hypothetical protein
MAIQVTCVCGERKELSPVHVGSRVRCKACGASFVVPMDGGPIEVAAATPAGAAPTGPVAFSMTWMRRGLLIMALFHVGALTATRALEAFEAVPQLPRAWVGLAVLMVGYLLGGALIGKWSPGRTVAEPAVAVLIVLGTIYGFQIIWGDVTLAPTWASRAGIGAGAFVAAIVGARIGERLQASV